MYHGDVVFNKTHLSICEKGDIFRIIEVQKAEDFFMTDAVVTYVELKEADLSSANLWIKTVTEKAEIKKDEPYTYYGSRRSRSETLYRIVGNNVISLQRAR